MKERVREIKGERDYVKERDREEILQIDRSHLKRLENKMSRSAMKNILKTS